MKRLILSVALGLLVAAAPWPVSAGSQTDPEIADKKGDGKSASNDIIAVWVDLSDPERVLVNFEAGAPPTPQYPSFHAIQERWTLWFKPTAGLPAGKTVAYISIRNSYGQTAPTTVSRSALIGFTTAAGTFDNLNNEVSSGLSVTAAGNVLTASVPMTNLKGFAVGTDAFKEMHANLVLANKGPAATAGGPDVNRIHETYDRAPDAGFGRDFTTAAPAPAAPDLTLELSAASNSSAAAPMGTASFDLTVVLVGNGTANASFAASGLPEGWTAAFTPESAVLDATAPNATVGLQIEVPADSENQSIEFTVSAMTQDNTSASLNLTLVVDSSLAGAAESGEGNETAPDEKSGAQEEGAGEESPGLGIVAGIAAMGSVFVLLRRRRL